MKQRTDSYIFTAHTMSAAEMLQIEVVRKTVKASNKLAQQRYKWDCQRAAYNGEPAPKKPTMYRVRLMARGPRKAAYQEHLAAGGPRLWMGFNVYLPQKYAERFDVYVHPRY